MSDEIHTERPIRWTNMEQPEFMWGPRPYTAKHGPGGIPKLNMTLAKRVGNPDTADAVIIVTEFGDGEIEFDYECLCAACQIMNEDSEEAMKGPVDYNVYGKPEPGTYFVKFWVEKFGGYFDPPDYEAGLEIAE